MLNEIADGVKAVLLAGVGAVAFTVEKGQQIVDELVKKGEITVEQGKAITDEWGRVIAKKVEEIFPKKEPEMSQEAQEVISKLDGLSDEEKEAILAKLAKKD